MASVNQPDKHGSEEFFAVVNKLEDLYITYRGRYVMTMAGKKPFVCVPKKQGEPSPLKNRTICAHVSQSIAICVFAGLTASKFMTFDLDIDDKEVLRRLVDVIESTGIGRDYIAISTSGGKGYHVDIFFNDRIDTQTLLDYYWHVMSIGDFNPRKIEFRPTYTQAIKLPLSKHHKTGRACWFLDHDTLEEIADRDQIFSYRQMPTSWFDDLVTKMNAESEAIIDDATEDVDESKAKNNVRQTGVTKKKLMRRESANIPIVTDLQNLPDVMEPGTRNELMKRIALRCRAESLSEEEILDVLTEWSHYQHEHNQDKMNSPLDVSLKDAIALAKWASELDVLPAKCRPAKHDFTVQNASNLLSCGHGVARKMYFYIAVYCNKINRTNVSCGRLGEIFGTLDVAPLKAMRRLLAAGLIQCKPGRRSHNGTNFICMANTYRLAKKLPPSTIENPLVEYVDIEGRLLQDRESLRARSTSVALLQILTPWKPSRIWLKHTLRCINIWCFWELVCGEHI